MEVSDQFHAPAALLSEKEPPPPCILDRRLRGPRYRCGQHGEVNILEPTGTRIPTLVVEPIASRYTGCATPATS
jgi:hypothetical protein